MIERKIVIGLITSTDYCFQIKNGWNPQYIESATAKLLAGWCWEYYNEYGKAPNKDIEAIFYTKLRTTNIPKDLAEEIEQEILPSLSQEYERDDLNVDYLITETKKHFSSRSLALHADTIHALRQKGKIEEATQLAMTYAPVNTTAVTFDNFVRSVLQIRKTEREQPVLLMKPWLREGQTTIIYGNYGSGKSLLTIAVAYLLGLRNYDEDHCEFGEWQVKNPTGTLYIDGELGEQEMEQRISQFEWLGQQASDRRIHILSIPEYQLATEDSFYLSDRTNQIKIITWLRNHPTYKLVVLDSVSTLFGLIEENDNSEWNTKINPFLRDLRALGVACILLHHSGKDSKRGLRGASSMGAMAHNIFRIANHDEKNIDAGEAWFILSKDKQRAAGYSFKTFSVHFERSVDERETHWETTDIF